MSVSVPCSSFPAGLAFVVARVLVGGRVEEVQLVLVRPEQLQAFADVSCRLELGSYPTMPEIRS